MKWADENATSVEISYGMIQPRTSPGGRLKKLLDQANKLGARYALIVGENEIASGKYALKDMTAGEQIEIAREQLLERFSPHV